MNFPSSPESEREAFKKAMKHLDCVEMPDAWGGPMFRHTHVEAMWDGWKARAAFDLAQCSREQVIEECAKVVEPKGPRPCDCERCYCGNIGDLEAVAAWDADAYNAKAIRALADTSTVQPSKSMWQRPEYDPERSLVDAVKEMAVSPDSSPNRGSE